MRQCHRRDLAITIKTVTTWSQKGAWGGKVDKNRLPKKAAVFGLEKVVNNPFWNVATLFSASSYDFPVYYSHAGWIYRMVFGLLPLTIVDIDVIKKLIGKIILWRNPHNAFAWQYILPDSDFHRRFYAAGTFQPDAACGWKIDHAERRQPDPAGRYFRSVVSSGAQPFTHH